MNSERRVIVFTQAHNAEKTLERCINSVINQTYDNIYYYLADSGSSDHTREIIKNYADRDKRIVPFYYKENNDWLIYDFIPVFLERYNENDYFIQLDADDEYVPSCFEELIRFTHDNRLDIAACASDFIDGVSGADLNKSVLHENIFVAGQEFESLFPVYFKFIRDSWGKLFSLQVFKEISFAEFDKRIHTGSVSNLCFEAMLYANTFGVLAKKLHRYYVYPDSFERKADSGRLRVVAPYLYSCYKDYLIAKCGRISDSNAGFLYGSYFRALSNKLPYILNAGVSALEKLKALHSIITNDLTIAMLKSPRAEGVTPADKKMYLDTIRSWIDLQGFIKGTEESALISQIRMASGEAAIN